MNTHSGPAEDSPAYFVYHVTEKLTGATLAAALKELASQDGERPASALSSWNQIKKLIASRHIEVNGNLCLDEARRVRAGDVVKLWRGSRPKPIHTADIRIAYFDSHLLIVEKPAGVTSVRPSAEKNLSSHRRQLQPTLDELIPPVLAKIQHLPWPPTKNPPRSKRNSQSNSKSNVDRLRSELSVFAVHRLDRDTSGLMVFARTRACEQKLIAMFRKHDVGREYVGVCHGQLQPQTIRSRLVRNRGDGLRGSMPDNAAPEQVRPAQSATTHIVGAKPIADGRYSLFRCRLETGRTHQIRIHLSEAGHRLCGESVYVFDSEGTRLNDPSGAPRQALHSDRLTFCHPITGESLRFEMPWPRDLADWIRSIQ